MGTRYWSTQGLGHRKWFLNVIVIHSLSGEFVDLKLCWAPLQFFFCWKLNWRRRGGGVSITCNHKKNWWHNRIIQIQLIKIKIKNPVACRKKKKKKNRNYLSLLWPVEWPRLASSYLLPGYLGEPHFALSSVPEPDFFLLLTVSQGLLTCQRLSLPFLGGKLLLDYHFESLRSG